MSNPQRSTALQVLRSDVDRSVNFVEEQLVGFLESRYVRKTPQYFIAYLSTQSGCNRGCGFCHLTTTGQTRFEDASHNDLVAQALHVLKEYRRDPPAVYMHYNFMARGEPLASKVLLESSTELLGKLGELARVEHLPAKFNVSTIMPATLHRSLIEVFPVITPTIYYSLYSVNEDWRRRWMPGAMPVGDALDRLKEYQDFSKKIVKIHHAFIEGENDALADVREMVNEIERRDIAWEFNLVRYNPASPAQGRESSEAAGELLGYLRSRARGKVQVIPRVGPDAKASCGMFYESPAGDTA